MLSPGVKFGPYEIVAPLGEGGMGEVYRARDPRLNRDVAIKVLRAELADGLQRFLREAQTLAALNHPNIAHIHGIESSAAAGPGGAAAAPGLVMELVDGEDLAAAIARGPMPVDEAIAIARQIADALEAAHDQGVVHRDLKPANVKVRPDGTVKVLDFGLAKALDLGGLSRSGSGASLTITTPAATVPGIILGTAAYMSPEQARGKVVDRRADIWAFGAMLYEMLTGERPFAGETIADVLAAIVTREPDLQSLPGSVPAWLRALIGRCLEKDARLRLRDIGEARILLTAPTAGESADDGAATRRARDRRRVMALAGGLVIAIAAVLGWPARRSPSNAGPMYLSLSFPGGVHLGAPQPSLALSPDGRLLAYTAGGPEGRPALWLRAFDEPAARVLSQEAGRNAVFSPDGEWIATAAGVWLVKTSVRSGSDVNMAQTAAAPSGLAWTSRDEIVFAIPRSGLWRVSASGGTPARVAEGQFFYPDALPGGERVIATIAPPDSRTADELSIAVVDLDTGAVRTIVEGGTYGRYAASGHVVYLRDGKLMAVAFDAASGQRRGDPAVLVSDVFMNPAVPSGNFAVSPDGTLVYASGSADDFSRRLVTVVRGQPARPLLEIREHFSKALMAPDGARVAVILRAMRDSLAVLDLNRGVLARISPRDMHILDAAWSDDGKHLVVSALEDEGPRRLYLLRPVPGAAVEQLTDVESMDGSFAPGGKAIVFTSMGRQRNADLFLLPLEGTRTPRPLLQTDRAEFTPAVSPDGRWIAYQSNQSGDFHLYIADFPRLENRVQASTGLPGVPVWSRDSRRLFYREGRSSRIMMVEVSATPEPSLGRPTLYAEIPGGPGGAFDVTTDGRLLAIEGEGVAAGREQLRVILDWFTDLRRKAPPRSN